MFSGKSEELMRRLRRSKIARLTVVTFKHALDDRLDMEQLVSHDGTRLDAQPLSDPLLIEKLGLQPHVQVIGIDEIQFFPITIVTTISTLVAAGKRVIVAGLNLDFRCVPFGPMPTLLAIADSITKLSAICSVCGNDGHFTQRLVDGKPASFDGHIIMVGAQEAYQARCRTCYTIDKNPCV
jgi:thymidine kinase